VYLFDGRDLLAKWRLVVREDLIFFYFLPLGATAQGELWPSEKSASILLCSSSTGSSYLPCRIYFILEADYLVSQ
jgi:hypothetical protein